MKYLHGLSAFFGVPVAYFFDEELEARVDAQLELATDLRDPSIRELVVQATGLSADMLEAITQIVRNARHIEGLEPAPGTSSTPSEGSAPRLPPRRRRRRARQRGEPTSTSGDKPPADETH
jgi:hypothetical protein